MRGVERASSLSTARQRLVTNPTPGGDICRDESEACLSLAASKAFCARDGAVRGARLELEFSRYETYEEKIREVYRPKGLLAYAAAAREYVRML